MEGRKVENEEVVDKIKAGIEIKENMMILWENNKNLIKYIAKQFTGYAEQEDLIQEGFISLYDAAYNYDKNKGAKFSTYSAYWIRMRMKRYIIECSRGIRIPEYEEYKRQQYNKYISDYEKKNGRKPQDREICDFFHIDKEKLAELEKLQNMANLTSTDSYIEPGEGDTNRIIDTIKGDMNEDSVILYVDYNIMMSKLWETMKIELENNEYMVIYYKYKHDMDIAEIEEKMELPRNEIMKLHRKAIRKLRRNNNTRKLDPGYSDSKMAKCYKKVGVEKYKTTWESVVELVAIN